MHRVKMIVGLLLVLVTLSSVATRVAAQSHQIDPVTTKNLSTIDETKAPKVPAPSERGLFDKVESIWTDVKCKFGVSAACDEEHDDEEKVSEAKKPAEPNKETLTQTSNSTSTAKKPVDDDDD